MKENNFAPAIADVEAVEAAGFDADREFVVNCTLAVLRYLRELSARLNKPIEAIIPSDIISEFQKSQARVGERILQQPAKHRSEGSRK